jgi:hypothetical protein
MADAESHGRAVGYFPYRETHIERDGILAMQRDYAAESILERFRNLENYPDETLAPYKEFTVSGKTYYFTPGGFLYRKDPGTEEVGGFFCGYLTDEVWQYRTDDS